MYYKRDEAFRYSFGTLIPGVIQTSKSDEPINMKLIDISLEGAKIQIGANLANLQKGENILIKFQILGYNFQTTSTIIWTKNNVSSIECGVQLKSDQDFKRELTDALKEYAKQNQ